MIYDISDNNSIGIAADLVNSGEIIVYTTDTLYGFGVDATNSIAINKLNELKNRIQPYSIIVDSFEMLNEYAITDNDINYNLNKIFPGPFTAILNMKNSDLSSLVTPNLSTIGIRIPNSQFILKVVNKNKKPIVTTSVNIHKEKALNTLDDIKNKFSTYNIFTDFCDSDSCGSTIIDFSTKNYKVIRKGDGDINL